VNEPTSPAVPDGSAPPLAGRTGPRAAGPPSKRRRLAEAHRAELADEAAFLRLSLTDLDRELAAGELERSDYEELRHRYEERAGTVAEALRQLQSSPGTVITGDQAPRRRFRLAARRHRLVLGWTAAACFAAAGVLLGLGVAGVAPFARPSSTLSAQTRIDIELAEAAVLAGHGHISLAVDTYEKVLALDPEQPEALADGGWLERVAGRSDGRPSLVAQGDREIAAAAALDPGYALAHGYEGVTLLEDGHNPSAAVGAFRLMLDDHPSAGLLASVRDEAVRAFAAAHQPLPRPLER
jgi:tetratricopeptide (TPR) repeat protein